MAENRRRAGVLEGQNEHWAPLAVKTLMIFGTLLLALRIAGAQPGFGALVVAAAVLVAVGYPLGDLYVLQTSGNWAAVAVDFGLALATLWAIGAASPLLGIRGGAVLFGAAAVALGEFFFHRWLETRVGLRAAPGDVDPHEKDE